MFNDLLNHFTFAGRETVDVARNGQRCLPDADVTLDTVAVVGPTCDSSITWGGFGDRRAGKVAVT